MFQTRTYQLKCGERGGLQGKCICEVGRFFWNCGCSDYDSHSVCCLCMCVCVCVCARAHANLGFRDCVSLYQAYSILCVVQATSAEFGLRADHTRLNTQIQEWISARNIMCIILPFYFYTSRAINSTLIMVAKNLFKKCNWLPRLGCRYFSTFWES